MLVDKFGRTVRYLRVSVTERCNFRCRYCMSEKPFSWIPKENLLSFEELFNVVRVGINSGINKIRITGGEPTVRENLESFIQMISSYAPEIDIALTTNGYLIKNYLEAYVNAGLKRINISLDSLNREIAHKIAQKDILPNVLDGINEALKYNIEVKLNSVILKGINDHEVINLLEFGQSNNISIRFIEYMENGFASNNIIGVTTADILSIVAQKYSINKIKRDVFSGPATLYELENGYRFGTIEPHRHDFCTTCDRLRLTAEGNLIGCLYYDGSHDIKNAVRENNIQLIQDCLNHVVQNKPEKNLWGNENFEISSRAFYETGG